MSTEEEPESQEPRKLPCRKCETFWGVFGVAVGLAVLFIGLDLATHGALTRVFTRSAHDDSD